MKNIRLHKALSTASLPLIVAHKKGEFKDTALRLFRDKETNCKVLINNLQKPFSPISGGALLPMVKKTVVITAAQLKDLVPFAFSEKMGVIYRTTPEIAKAMSVRSAKDKSTKQRIFCALSSSAIPVRLNQTLITAALNKQEMEGMPEGGDSDASEMKADSTMALNGVEDHKGAGNSGEDMTSIEDALQTSDAPDGDLKEEDVLNGQHLGDDDDFDNLPDETMKQTAATSKKKPAKPVAKPATKRAKKIKAADQDVDESTDMSLDDDDDLSGDDDMSLDDDSLEDDDDGLGGEDDDLDDMDDMGDTDDDAEATSEDLIPGADTTTMTADREDMSDTIADDMDTELDGHGDGYQGHAVDDEEGEDGNDLLFDDNNGGDVMDQKELSVSSGRMKPDTSMASVYRSNLMENLSSVKNPIVHLVLAGGDRPTYYLMMNYKPVAVLNSVNASDTIKPLFKDPMKLNKVFVQASEKGITNAVSKDFGITPMVVEIKASDIINREVARRESRIKASYKRKRETVDNRVRQSMHIACVGINKGLWKGAPNPIRTALIEEFASLNVNNPERVIDRVMERETEPYLRTLMAKANEIARKSPLNRNDLSQFVTEANYQPVDSVKSATMDRLSRGNRSVQIEETASEMFETIAGNTVDLDSGSVDAIRSRLKFNRR